jgi:CCCH-type zinc finger
VSVPVSHVNLDGIECPPLFTPSPACSHVKKTAAELPAVASMFKDYGWRGDGRKAGALAAEAAKAAEKSSEPPMYKMSMCRFMVNGKCQYGDKCTYAHSEAERRQQSSSGRGVKSEHGVGSTGLSSSGQWFPG